MTQQCQKEPCTQITQLQSEESLCSVQHAKHELFLEEQYANKVRTQAEIPVQYAQHEPPQNLVRRMLCQLHVNVTHLLDIYALTANFRWGKALALFFCFSSLLDCCTHTK